MSTAPNKNGNFEREVHALSGWIMLVVNIALVIGAIVSSLTVHLVPVFGTILAVLLLGESPHPYHAVGIGLIFTGIWLATRKPSA